MKDNGMQENESFEFFKRIVPKNPIPWEGGVVLYSTWSQTFFNIAFGAGDNLDDDDTDQGFNDYIMASQFEAALFDDSSFHLADTFNNLKSAGYVDSDMAGVGEEIGGGQWLLKHKDWRSGDIRRFLMEALEFAGYGVPKGCTDGWCRDLIYVGATYDTYEPKKQKKRRTK